MKGVATRLSLAQGATGLIGGVVSPFFGPWLASKGLSAVEIGALAAAGRLLLVFLGPVTGMVADARNDRRAMMLFLYGVMSVSYATLNFTSSHTLIFIAAVAAALASGAASPLLETVSIRLADRHGFDYGHVRVWGSAVFVAGNLVSGVVKSLYGIGMVPPWLTVSMAISFTSIVLLPAPPPGHPRGHFATRFMGTLGEARELLRSTPFLLFLLAASFDQGSHAVYYTYGGLHWLALGYPGWLVGFIWPLGIFAEVVLMAFSRRVFDMFGSTRLLQLGALACVVRWSVLAFDPPLPIVILAQILHGATFALAHLGAMYFILKAVPPRLSATAQSLYTVTSTGVVTGIATLASSPLYAQFGGRSYLLMAAMGVVAVAFASALGRNWDGAHLMNMGSDEAMDVV